MKNRDLERLGRIVYALRLHRHIILPWISNGRPNSRIREIFSLGPWRGNPLEVGPRFLLRIDTETSRDGKQAIKQGSFEPCDWSINDVIFQSAHWEKEVIGNLPSLPCKGTDWAVDQILDVDAIGHGRLGLCATKIVPASSGFDCELDGDARQNWSFDDFVTSRLEIDPGSTPC